MKLLMGAVLSVALGWFPVAGNAAPCAGFSDVDTSNAFCPNVDWLKNRGITLGCTGSTYCPDAFVTRLQMAAFMNRLGEAFTPLVFTQANSGTTSFPSNQSAFHCVTGDVLIDDYRRFANVIAMFTLQGFNPATGPAYLTIDPVFSIDGGTSWSGFSGTSRAQLPVNPGTYAPTVVTVTPDIPIFGASYRFAVAVNASLPVNNVFFNCQLRLSISNRNGTNVPY